MKGLALLARLPLGRLQPVALLLDRLRRLRLGRLAAPLGRAEHLRSAEQRPAAISARGGREVGAGEVGRRMRGRQAGTGASEGGHLRYGCLLAALGLAERRLALLLHCLLRDLALLALPLERRLPRHVLGLLGPLDRPRHGTRVLLLRRTRRLLMRRLRLAECHLCRRRRRLALFDARVGGRQRRRGCFLRLFHRSGHRLLTLDGSAPHCLADRTLDLLRLVGRLLGATAARFDGHVVVVFVAGRSPSPRLGRTKECRVQLEL